MIPAKRPFWVLVFALGVAAATLGVIFIPNPQYFAFDRAIGITGGGGGGPFVCGGIQPTAGTQVVFQWSAPTNVTFDVWSCTSHRQPDGWSIVTVPVYEGRGTTGSGSFQAYGSVYLFRTYCSPGGVAPPPCVGSNVSGYFLASISAYLYHAPQFPAL